MGAILTKHAAATVIGTGFGFALEKGKVLLPGTIHAQVRFAILPTFTITNTMSKRLVYLVIFTYDDDANCSDYT